jgi:hypothetical protein
VLSQKKGSSLRFLNKPIDSPVVDIKGEVRKATVGADCLSMAALREGLHRAALNSRSIKHPRKSKPSKVGV